jgi:hypothetical protein
VRAKPNLATPAAIRRRLRRGRRGAGPGVGALTATVAAVVAAGVLGTAWALQAATLPPPDPGHLVAARAMSWLAGDRLAESTFAVGGGPPVRSSCTGSWLPVGGRRELVVRLRVAGRTPAVVPIGRPYVTLRGVQVARPAGRRLAQLALAGCPPVLESLLAGLVRRQSSTPVGRARLAGRDALTLRVWTRAGRLTVYLETGSKKPFAVALAGPYLTGSGRLLLTEPSARTIAGGA